MFEMLRKKWIRGKMFTRKSSLKHIREDIRVNEIVVCEESLRKKVIGKIKESGEVQVV